MKGSESTKLEKINQYIINLNIKLYNDVCHVVNPTLSRNPYMSRFLTYYLGKRKVCKVGIIKKIQLLIKYYIQFYIRFLVFIVKFFIYKVLSVSSIKGKKVDYILDVNFIVNGILQNGRFYDNYFKNLDIVLEESNYNVTYLVKSFIGSELNLFKFCKLIKILNTSEKSIVTEFDLLSFSDIFKVFVYSNIYPFKSFGLKFDTGDKLADLAITTSNIEALSSSAFTRFVRYYVGVKLGQLFQDFSIISNCEYKCHDKIFYKGVRKSNKNVCIYGCQFFIDYPVWLNTRIPKEEVQFGVTPDIALVNGEVNMFKHGVRTEKGVSLRYDYLFKGNSNFNLVEHNILILLSAEKSISQQILNVCLESDFLKNVEVIIRPHPSLNMKPFKKMLSQKWKVESSKLLEEQFQESSVIISSGSGTLVEAVVKGKSVILIELNDSFTSNPLSYELGKGVIWDSVSNSSELDKIIDELITVRNNEPEQIEKLSKKYLEQYFFEPSKANIKKCFNI